MKVYRINKLFFPTLFASVSALSGTFKDLNPDYLVKYYRSNIDMSCVLSEYQILQNVFTNPNIPQNQSACFVLDKSNASDIKYIMKPVAGCSPEALHPKIKSVATSMCPSTTSSTAETPANTASKGSGKSAAEVAQVISATIVPVAAAVQMYKGNIASEKKEYANAAKAAPEAPASLLPAASSAATGGAINTATEATTSIAANPEISNVTGSVVLLDKSKVSLFTTSR